MNIMALTTISRRIPRLVEISSEVKQSQAKELAYIPKYLEVAAQGGKDRFNPEEVSHLTSLFKMYLTDGSKIEILKELLNIGSEHGRQLSITEITNFLERTSGLNQKGQKRVLTFMKYSKEKLARVKKDHYTIEDIRADKPYEEFKAKEMKHLETPYGKLHPEAYTEEKIKLAYEHMIQEEYKAYQNPYYRAVLEKAKEGNDICSYISKGHAAFVEGIASCENPEKLAQIVNELGVTNATSYNSNELVQILDLSKGDMRAVRCVNNLFYPEEILRIGDAINKKIKSGQRVDLSKLDYEGIYAPKDINGKRNTMLRVMGIADSVSVDHIKKVYVKPPRILPGDYGRGKNNR